MTEVTELATQVEEAVPPKAEYFWSANCIDDDRPDYGESEEVLRVHLDKQNLIVELNFWMDGEPEWWGELLGDLVFVIGDAIAEANDMTHAEAMALIRKGFNSGNTADQDIIKG